MVNYSSVTSFHHEDQILYPRLAGRRRGPVNTLAGEAPKPYVGSAEFEKLKTLAGSWQGTTDMGKGPMPINVQYRVVSGGSAVEERLFADTPAEMVTIYHDQNGKLSLTHYCTLCNRPAMSLVKSDASAHLRSHKGLRH